MRRMMIMSKLFKLINRCRQEKSLAINALVYLMYKTKICGKYTAGLVSMDYIYYKVEKKYRLKAKEYASKAVAKNIGERSKKVWLFWWQGIDSAPELVKSCYASVKKYFEDWEIIVIDEKNYLDYVDIPEAIVRKHNADIITHTHFSDILRLALLCKYGGVWLDATVYCTGKINQECLESDLFCYRNGWMDQENISFSSWFISAKSNEPILSASLMLLYDYWEDHNYLIHYFLLHMFVKLVSDELKKQWEKIPYFNHNDNHLLANELPKEYDQQRLNYIWKLTNFHKLSYKINLDPQDCRTTYYHIVHEDLFV